jgi:hypothetical protein
MFVRWQSRKKTRHVFFGRGKAGDIRWTAILVEAVRIDGKPRQKHVACLGSILESEIKWASVRGEFWTKATERLESLDLPSAERRSIEASIAETVSRPTKQDIAAEKRASQRRKAEWAKKGANLMTPVRRA